MNRMRPFVLFLTAAILLATAGCTLPAPLNGNTPPAPAAAPSGEPASVAPTPASGGKISGAYWFLLPNPDDDTYALVMSDADRIPWTEINRLYLGFATVHDGVLTDLPTGDAAGDAARRSEMQNRVRTVASLARQHNPGIAVFITSNFGEGMDDEYSAAARDPQKFADSVVSYLKAGDLDGYDMDWESNSIDDYAPQLTSLLSTTRAAMAAAGNSPRGRPYLLTHTVWPGHESPSTVAGLADAVDQVNIMSYGPGETYELATYADSYAAAGFPYGKMIGGIESESGYGESGGPDTQDSVAAKCAYVKEKDLAGLFEWRFDNDMRPDNAPPTYQAAGWMSACLAG